LRQSAIVGFVARDRRHCIEWAGIAEAIFSRELARSCPTTDGNIARVTQSPNVVHTTANAIMQARRFSAALLIRDITPRTTSTAYSLMSTTGIWVQP
jgi:hypothetical protein